VDRTGGKFAAGWCGLRVTETCSKVAGLGAPRLYKRYTNGQSVWQMRMDIVRALLFVTCETDLESCEATQLCFVSSRVHCLLVIGGVFSTQCPSLLQVTKMGSLQAPSDGWPAKCGSQLKVTRRCAVRTFENLKATTQTCSGCSLPSSCEVIVASLIPPQLGVPTSRTCSTLISRSTTTCE
jgi:hypothetical protein